jgi:hypothetical protein
MTPLNSITNLTEISVDMIKDILSNDEISNKKSLAEV